MKKMLLSLLIIVFSINVYSKNINQDYSGRFSSYLGILYNQTAKVQNVLSEYLGENLGCSNVKVCIYVTRRIGMFHSGEYLMNLKSTCSENFNNFNYEIHFAFDWDEMTQIIVNYNKDGEEIEEMFKIPDEPYGTRHSDGSYDHSGCEEI